MSLLEGLVDLSDIQLFVRRGYTHAQIADILGQRHPNTRGLSERSVRRFCRRNGIVRLSSLELDGIVEDQIARYGHGYGRSLMQGSIWRELSTVGGSASQRRIAASLKRLAPAAYQARARDVLDRTNPIPYYAPYFGYKVHMDQNEKIAQDFGCTHVALIDGCSRMVCGYASMPVKNPILIYEYVYRPAVMKYGLWDQLRVDKGKEFVLCLFVQVNNDYSFWIDK